MPSVGEMAPDFEMLNDEGKKVKLSDFRGKKVVMYFTQTVTNQAVSA